MNFSQLAPLLALGFFLAPASGPLLGFELTGQTWPPDTTIAMQLELGPTGVQLIDGLGTWDNSAADALAIWNQNLELVKFSWVLNSSAPKDSLDGYNSVFFSNTILGEGFGDDTLAATIVWYYTADYGTAIEADVVFNTAQTFNSYRGPLLPDSYDFHRVALHEFGHVLGLAHVYNFPTGQALMEPVISNLDHLAPDDIAGVDYLYGYRFTSPLEFGGFVVGQDVFFSVAANNHPISYSAVGLPAGLKLDTAKGEISGVPLEAGTFEVTITAHGSPRDVVATVTVFVGAAGITSGSYPEPIQVGTFITYTITAGNNPASFSATGLPPGLTLRSKTGVISGVPTLDGNYSTAVVAHGAQYDASGAVSFAVLPAYRQSIADLFAGDTIIRTVQDPVRDRLYVLTNRELKVVDTQLQAISTSIPLNFPFDLSLSIDNTKVWVTEGTSIHAYSLTDFSRLPDIPNGPFYYQQVREGLGNKLYVTNTQLSSGLYEIDIATGTVTPIRVAMPGYDIGALIDTSPDGRNLYAGFVDGPPVITRYDISGGSAVMLGTRTLTTSNLFDLTVSPDGKLLAYSTDSESNPSDRAIFSIPATKVGAAATQIDPSAEDPFFNFGTGPAYVHTVVNAGYAHYRLDFVNPSSGFPYNSWDLPDFGPAFADHSGTNLFLTGYDSISVYSLAPDGSPGVEPAPKSLVNVSTRSVVGVDDQRMIGGFIVTGDTSKKIAFRAIGPTLPLLGAMTDPAISVYDSSGAVVAANNNWNQYRDDLINAGLAPFNEHEAGLVATLDPGSYTAVVSFEPGGTGGVGLVELYDLSADNSGRIANISTRSKVGTDDNVMIGGFVVGGKEVTKVIARAIGPSLAGSLTGVLLDPTLDLYNVNGVRIASNDDWRSDQEAEITATGIAPADNRESALVASLAPGPYTAIVRGKDNTTGIALVEIYNLDATSGAAKSTGK